MDTFELMLFMLVLGLAWFGFLSICATIVGYFMVRGILANISLMIDGKFDKMNSVIDNVGELLGRKKA